MTPDLDSLLTNIYRLSKYLGMSFVDIESLTTYEYDKYVSLASKDIEDESEERKSTWKALGPIAGLINLFKGKRR